MSAEAPIAGQLAASGVGPMPIRNTPVTAWTPATAANTRARSLAAFTSAFQLACRTAADKTMTSANGDKGGQK